MTSFPKERPPARKSALERWISDKAAQDDVEPRRMRQALSYMVVVAVLSRLDDGEGAPGFVIKGGVSMLLRFGGRARFSKDLDVAFRRDISQLEGMLAETATHPVGHFVAEPVGVPKPIGATGARRIGLRIRYKEQPWGTVPLEVSMGEGHSVDPDRIDWLSPAPDLATFGFESQGLVPCMPVAYQVAQKLHACTEVFDEGENGRSQDLLDLQLLEELIGGGDWPEVRRACEEVFEGRKKQAWPPPIAIQPSWRHDYEQEARENDFPVTDAEEACRHVAAMIERIARE